MRQWTTCFFWVIMLAVALAAVVAIVLVTGCGRNPAEKAVTPQAQVHNVMLPGGAVHDNPRFTVASYGYFAGGYNDEKREIFVVVDTATKKQYLAITGCGTTELTIKQDGEDTKKVEE